MEEKAELELRLDDKAFEEMREELTKKYPKKWVTIFRGKVISVGDTYDESASNRLCFYGKLYGRFFHRAYTFLKFLKILQP